MKTIEKIVYMTEKGQITLPVAWRRKIGTNAVRISERSPGSHLNISPVETKEDDETGWTTVFNKDRDNGGKGLTADEFLKALGVTRKQVLAAKKQK